MDRRYVVPLFQRPYVWNREKHWPRLWGDITAKANEYLAHGTDPQYHLRKHFLGAAVISQISVFGIATPAVEVIDGQQRLTTLQILLRAFYGFSKACGYAQTARRLEHATENNFVTDHQRYKVWPTSGDRKVYEAVHNAGSPDDLKTAYPLQFARYARKPSPRPNLVEAYLFFYDAIRDYCALQDDLLSSVEGERVDALFIAVTKYLEIVAIELEEGDDPQTIFETLNALGEPLLPSDLLRNFVFLEATRRQEDVDRLYHTYWSAYDASDGHDGFWKEKQVQGRLNRPRLDLFIFHYLTAQAKREIPITYLYQEFRDWWLTNCSVVEDGLKDLQAASVRYRSFMEPGGNTRLRVFCDRLKTLDVGTVYPVLLLLTEQVSAADLPDMLSDIESYLVRRYVCGLTPKNYNNTFLSLLKTLSQANPLNRAALRQALSALTGDSARWPDDAEFERAWLDTPVYQTLGPRRTALVLKALDLQRTTAKQEQLHIAGEVSVEHVLPQSGSLANWPFYDQGSIVAAPDAAVVFQRQRLLHSFGNLTLLTQELNSSVSNGPFTNKLPEITLQSSLRLNAYFQAFQPSDAWHEETIRARGKALFQTALQIWPAPDAYSIAP